MTDDKQEKLIRLVMRAMGMTHDQAQVIVEQAIKRVEAGLMIGVAGFWS